MENKPLSFEAVFTVFTGLLLGYLVVMQAYSVENINDIVARDRTTNVFREIQILHEKNNELKEEIADLEAKVVQYSDRASYLQAVGEEITRYEKITGMVGVKGSGVELIIKSDKGLGELWFVDIVNELLNAGAEAVSVQGIRLVDDTNGFDALPTGQIFLNGVELTSPYEFKAIGPANEIIDSLGQANGVLERLSVAAPDAEITFDKAELVEIGPAL